MYIYVLSGSEETSFLRSFFMRGQIGRHLFVLPLCLRNRDGGRIWNSMYTDGWISKSRK